MENIRKNEWITDGGDGWFNGYYDDHKNPVECCEKDRVRMMLTSQVFAIMSGTATKEQTAAISRSADKYLFDEKAGGYRLNTNFREEKFDLGRMFGFAYGEKENGAVFSHMAVMYANALYSQGFVKEGYKVLNTLLHAAMNFESSYMYPGLPEYFDSDGRGLYAYLTGAASWYMLTMITEAFGVRGEIGNLVIAPALMAEQFDKEGNASLYLEFAGKKFEIHISNPDKKEYGEYQIVQAYCDEKEIEKRACGSACMKKETIEQLSSDETHNITIVLQ